MRSRLLEKSFWVTLYIAKVFSLLFHEMRYYSFVELLLYVVLCKKLVNRLKCTHCNGILLSSVNITRIWIFALAATFIKYFSSDADQRS